MCVALLSVCVCVCVCVCVYVCVFTLNGKSRRMLYFTAGNEAECEPVWPSGKALGW